MNKLLLIGFITSVSVNADINKNKSFPAYTPEELHLLNACCENNVSCCIDFSKSNSLEDFKNKVKAIDTLRNRSMQQIRSNTQSIKKRLDESQRITNQRIKQRDLKIQQQYNNRFQNIGNFNYNN